MIRAIIVDDEPLPIMIEHHLQAHSILRLQSAMLAQKMLLWLANPL